MTKASFPFADMLPELQNLVVQSMTPLTRSLFAFTSKTYYQLQSKSGVIHRTNEIILACATENQPHLIQAIQEEFDLTLISPVDLLSVRSPRHIFLFDDINS